MYNREKLVCCKEQYETFSNKIPCILKFKLDLLSLWLCLRFKLFFIHYLSTFGENKKEDDTKH